MTKGNGRALAGRVRKLRKSRAWSQDHLAGAANLSLRTIQRVENGHGASPETLQALASAFAIDVKTLVEAGKEPSPAGFRVSKLQAMAAGIVFLGLIWLLWTYGHLHFLKHWFE